MNISQGTFFIDKHREDIEWNWRNTLNLFHVESVNGNKYRIRCVMKFVMGTLFINTSTKSSEWSDESMGLQRADSYVNAFIRCVFEADKIHFEDLDR